MNDRHVLLVEGEPNRAKSSLGALSGAGMVIVRARTEQEALAKVRSQAVDVVVAAASGLPGSSLDFVQKIRQKLPDVRVILVLDRLDNEFVRRAFAAGVQQYLVRPDADLLKITVLATIRMLSQAGQERNAARVATWDEELITSTDAQNSFGEVLKKVSTGRRVVITKYDARAAVVLPYGQYLAETGAQRLDTLSDEFDKLLANMQTEKALAGMAAAFDASPAELGKAAVAAARKRR